MKKILVILVALIGFGFSANAQCDIKTVSKVSGSWTMGEAAHYDAVKLYNSNDYNVTVRLDITFVSYNGDKKTESKTFTIKANSDVTTEGKYAGIDSKWSRVNCDKSTITITIL